MKSGDKVCIGLVTNGSINDKLVLDFLKIATCTDKYEAFMTVANIGTTTKSRNVIVKNFLDDTKAKWLLMIDSDERLSLEAFKKLVDTAHDKERLVVSGLVFAKFGDDNAIRPVPTIYRQTENVGLQSIDDYPLDSVIPISAAGTGCLLVHRSVLELMREHATENQGRDWCWFQEGAIGQQYFGEDILFSKKLNALGIQMWAHTGAILPHLKDFWLDERHHAPMREAAIKHSQTAE